MAPSVHLVGVLNVTPDSFSDGGLYVAPEAALVQAKKLRNDGAELVDVGANSTRPGSVAVGEQEEHNRLAPVLELLSEEAIPFAVDTYHASVAQFAIDSGAVMINDVSAGFDREMFQVIAGSSVRYVMMYSRCKIPHEFSPEYEGDLLLHIEEFFRRKIEAALKAGVKESQLVLDTGMGGFISSHPEKSWQVIRNYSRFLSFGLPLYFGSSRKGFLKLPHEEDISERDVLTALTGGIVVDGLPDSAELYIRVHNVREQLRYLSREQENELNG